MKVKIQADFDIVAALEAALGNASISGIGPDSNSDYDITDISVGGDYVTVEIEVYVERVQGKFASKDDIAEELMVQLEAVEVSPQEWKIV